MLKRITKNCEDLVLTEDTVIDGDLNANNVFGTHDLTVKGDIDAVSISVDKVKATNINVKTIHADKITCKRIETTGNLWAETIDADTIISHANVHAVNIHTGKIRAKIIDAYLLAGDNIEALIIDATKIAGGDIFADHIICDSRTKNKKDAKTIGLSLLQNKLTLHRLELMN